MSVLALLALRESSFWSPSVTGKCSLWESAESSGKAVNMRISMAMGKVEHRVLHGSLSIKVSQVHLTVASIMKLQGRVLHRLSNEFLIQECAGV